jgi:hypothetical protein
MINSLPRKVEDPRRGNAGSLRADPAGSAISDEGLLAGPPALAHLLGLPGLVRQDRQLEAVRPP